MLPKKKLSVEDRKHDISLHVDYRMKHIERYKTIKREKRKCNKFLEGEKCDSEFCNYSHTNESDLEEARVPKIDIDSKVESYEYNYFVKIPYYHRVRGVSNISKFVVVEGKGKRPSKHSNLVYRFYGINFRSEKDKNVFIDSRASFRTLKVNIQASKPRVRKVPVFFHFILGSMREGEGAFFKVHPFYFSTRDKRRDEIDFGLLHKDKIFNEKKEKNFLPQHYVYYYFQMDDIDYYVDYSKMRFRSFEEAEKFIRERMDECNEKRNEVIKLPMEENRPLSFKTRFMSIKKVIQEYQKCIDCIINNQAFSTKRRYGRRNDKFDCEKRKNIRKELFLSLNLRICNSFILRREYYDAMKYLDYAKRHDSNNFQVKYYELICNMKLKKLRKANDIINEIKKLIKEKVIEPTEKQLLNLKKQKKVLRNLIDNDEVLTYERTLKNNLKENLQKGFISEGKKRERMEEDLVKVEKEKKDNVKVWFGPEGDEFYEPVENGLGELGREFMMRYGEMDLKEFKEKLKVEGVVEEVNEKTSENEENIRKEKELNEYKSNLNIEDENEGEDEEKKKGEGKEEGIEKLNS